MVAGNKIAHRYPYHSRVAFGDYLDDLMADKNYESKQIANLIDIHVTQVRDWRTNRSLPTIERFRQLLSSMGRRLTPEERHILIKSYHTSVYEYSNSHPRNGDEPIFDADEIERLCDDFWDNYENRKKPFHSLFPITILNSLFEKLNETAASVSLSKSGAVSILVGGIILCCLVVVNGGDTYDYLLRPSRDIPIVSNSSPSVDLVAPPQFSLARERPPGTYSYDGGGISSRIGPGNYTWNVGGLSRIEVTDVKDEIVLQLVQDGIIANDAFDLLGGHYTIRWQAHSRSTETSCTPHGYIENLETGYNSGQFSQVAQNFEVEFQGQQQIFGLRPGKYRFRVDSACDWALVIFR